MFARSPETKNGNRMKLLSMDQLDDWKESKRPISMVLKQEFEKKEHVHTKKSESQTRTDQGSHLTSQALNQHKYGDDEDDVDQESKLNRSKLETEHKTIESPE